jgi:MFS family permease
MLFNTLAASFIWGINTLFLLDAGLSSTAAFTANALFTAGMVLFEVPTGVVADTWGRRVSYLLGSVTLAVSTVLYWLAWHMQAPFWAWAVTSVLLGLGFTFFSGATEAWLVDALRATGFIGGLEPVFARGQVITGIGMLTGSVAGGYIAQATNLGVPFVLRAIILAVMFAVALAFMRDIGFNPAPRGNPIAEMRSITADSIEYGWRVPQVRYLMLAAPFTGGVGIYVFYALQPYLLELYGDEEAYAVAGLAAAIVAGSQIAGGYLAPRIRGVFHKRTSALILGTLASCAILVALGFTNAFLLALGLLVAWGLIFAAEMPIRQAYLNGMIPSQQRATVLSFDSLMGSTGGVVIQPVLGKSADVYSYATSYVIGAAFQVLAVPFLLLSRRERSPSDAMVGAPEPAPAPAAS